MPIDSSTTPQKETASPCLSRSTQGEPGGGGEHDGGYGHGAHPSRISPHPLDIPPSALDGFTAAERQSINRICALADMSRHFDASEVLPGAASSPHLAPGEALLADLRIPPEYDRHRAALLEVGVRIPPVSPPSRNLPSDPVPDVSWSLPPTPPKRRKAAFFPQNRLFAPGPALSLVEALLLLAWWISLSVVFFYLAVG